MSNLASYNDRIITDINSYITFHLIVQGAPFTKKRQATFLTKCLVLTKRSIINMHRDMGYYWLRFDIYIAIYVSIGTIFFNVGYSFASIQVSKLKSLYAY